MTGRPRIPAEVLALAVQMKRDGATYHEIMVALQIGKTSVWKAFKNFAEGAGRTAGGGT